MSTTKTFPLRDILSITTGRLLTKAKGPDDNGIGDIKDVMEWMTGESPFCHAMPRFAEECKPWLYRWFPHLAVAEACDDKLNEWIEKSDSVETACFYWFAELKMLEPKFQDTYDVPKMPQDDHERKDPYDELVAMRGTDEGIILVGDKSCDS